MIASALKLCPLVVELDGAPLAPALVQALNGVRIRQRLSTPAQCELTFCDPPASATGGLRHGARLQVHLAGESAALFAGEVTVVELCCDAAHGRELRIRGYDGLHRLRKRQAVRAHLDVGLAELVRELAGDLGCDVDVPPSASALRWRQLIQHGQTNLELLQEVTAACGLFYLLAEDTLRLLTLEGTGEPVPLVLGESLLEARVEASAERSCRRVAASGWDPLRVQVCEGEASEPRVGRRIEAEADPETVGGSENRLLISRIVEDDRQAQALAQAEMDRSAAREVALWGVAAGNSNLCAGVPIEVGGLGADFDGTYVLTEVTHLFEKEHGFVSEISTAPPLLDGRPAGASFALGEVTRVDDPEGSGRVQVSLSASSGVETGWMSVVLPGAGEGKGLMMLPDVGDRVIVLWTQENPGLGVVLGGLYSQDGPPDSGVEGAATKRHTWQTAGGHKVRLDDAKRSVRIEATNGSFVEMTPDLVSVHGESDLRIEAPGRTVTIAGKAINFEEA